MDAEARFHNKRMVYVKYCIHKRQHSSQLDLLELDCKTRVSQKGQIVVKNMLKWISRVQQIPRC